MSWSLVTVVLWAMVVNLTKADIGATELVYSIEDVLNNEMVQDGDTVALPPSGHLKSVFFSEEGVCLLT
jgi:hypothetical protein